ncbi:MAG TPA: hypothetical protein VF013_04935 [Candidatus Limnocylindria bacterium]
MSDTPVTIAYYYRVRWGHADEFLALFRRNHYPILADQLASGRFLEIRCHRPRFHGAGDADWTFMVTITHHDWAAVESHSDAEIAARLFPDQDRYRAEERRRFELIEAHWDVPLEEVALDAETEPSDRRGLGFGRR